MFTQHSVHACVSRCGHMPNYVWVTLPAVRCTHIYKSTYISTLICDTCTHSVYTYFCI